MEMEIRKWIQEFIQKNNGICIDESISLIDPRNGLMPRDLLVLFFELQKEFDVTFTEQNIIDQRFDFVDQIVNAIFENKEQ